MVAELDEVIRDLRRHVFGVRASAAASLDETLTALADQIAGERGLAVSVDVDAALAASLEGRQDDLVHIVREVLANASRNGRASAARVSLRGDGEHAVLEVSDDGGATLRLSLPV
jgi:signal transduction histidine kinase